MLRSTDTLRPASRRVPALWIALALMLVALLPFGAAARFAAGKDDPAGQPTPDPSTRSVRPAPDAKNAIEPPASDPAGVTEFRAAPGAAAQVEPQAITAAQDNARLLTTCGAVRDGEWLTTSLAFQTIVSCPFTAPQDGYALITASASVGLPRGGNAYEARFRVGVDDLSGAGATDRWVNVYADSTDGSDKTVTATTRVPVTAGAHTVSFVGASASFFGRVQVIDPLLSVLFVPRAATDVLTCGVSDGDDWLTSAADNFQQIRSCALTAPQAGYALITASATAHLPQGSAEYEGRFRVGVDGLAGSAESDRWVNVYGDNSDGTDETVATSLLVPVSAGAHSFSFLGYRYRGAGTVQLFNPTLSVIYLRAASVTAKTCSAATNNPWTAAPDAYTPVVSCTLNVPSTGWALVDASASGGIAGDGGGGAWEGRFRLSAEGANGSAATDRLLNIYPDIGDGSDKVIAATWLANVNRGSRTFSFVARRSAGPGAMRLYSPSLTVIVPGATQFLPISGK